MVKARFCEKGWGGAVGRVKTEPLLLGKSESGPFEAVCFFV